MFIKVGSILALKSKCYSVYKSFGFAYGVIPSSDATIITSEFSPSVDASATDSIFICEPDGVDSKNSK